MLANTEGDSTPYVRPLMLAIGSESRGLSPEVLRACHLILRIPGSNDIAVTSQQTSDTAEPNPVPSSLNTAVATGILLHELTTLRHGAGAARKSCFAL